MTLTDDEYVAQVERAYTSLRARNAAWLEAINNIQVPAVHEAVTARFDSDGTLVSFEVEDWALSEYTNTELEQIITDVLRNTRQAMHAQMMELLATYMAPNSPLFDPNAVSEPYVVPPS